MILHEYKEICDIYGQSPLWTAINRRFMQTKDKSQTLIYAAQIERQHSEEQKRAEAIQKAKAEQALAEARAHNAQNAICAEEAPQAVTNSENAENANTAALAAYTQMITGAFRVTGTKEQIKALALFMKQNGIQYEVLK